MNDYIRIVLSTITGCVSIGLPEGLDVDPIDGIQFTRHDRLFVEYLDVSGFVITRHVAQVG